MAAKWCEFAYRSLRLADDCSIKAGVSFKEIVVQLSDTSHPKMGSESPASEGINPVGNQVARDQVVVAPAPEEYGGPKGPEPTRFGDWERNGRCIDF